MSGFSLSGKGINLSKHSELQQNGAIGLADDDFTHPIKLFKRGFSLGEIKKLQVLIAAGDKSLRNGGLSKQSVGTFKTGWALDPIESETIPLIQILELHVHYP